MTPPQGATIPTISTGIPWRSKGSCGRDDPFALLDLNRADRLLKKGPGQESDP